MSKCISDWGEFSEHEYTSKPICDYCGQISEMLAIVQNEDFRTALVVIQELHKPVIEGGAPVGCERCDWDEDWQWPCRTRMLTDDALGGDNNG